MSIFPKDPVLTFVLAKNSLRGRVCAVLNRTWCDYINGFSFFHRQNGERYSLEETERDALFLILKGNDHYIISIRSFKFRRRILASQTSKETAAQNSELKRRSSAIIDSQEMCDASWEDNHKPVTFFLASSGGHLFYNRCLRVAP